MRAEFKRNLPHLAIVSPGYNCAAEVPLFINSLKIQNYTNWDCYCIDDASTDNTYEALKLAIGSDPRFHIRQNGKNMGALWNRDYIISKLNPNDIVIYMDMDDWFGTKYAFEYLIKEYASRNILVTTARNHCLRNGLEDDGVIYTSRNQLLQLDHHCMALFSFPARLWHYIPKYHFVDPRRYDDFFVSDIKNKSDEEIQMEGKYYMSDEDPCFTFPILWMAGPILHQHLFVDNFIIYNNIRPICDDYKVGDEGHRSATNLILQSFRDMVKYNILYKYEQLDELDL